MLFALTILAGWSLAYTLGLAFPDWAWRSWPAVSAVSGVTLTALWKRYRFPWAKAVAALAGAMLLLDGVYLGYRSQNVPVEVAYSRALDAALIGQLVLIGMAGVRSDWVGFLGRLRSCLGRIPRLANVRQGSEG